MPDQTPEDIQLQMRHARRELGADVFTIAEKARVITDWKYYLRSNPWLCLGAAATLGYLLVPQRIRVTPDMTPVAELVKATREATEAQAPQKPGLSGMLLNMLGSTLLQGGLAIASQQMNELLHQYMGPATHAGNGHAGNGHGSSYQEPS